VAAAVEDAVEGGVDLLVVVRPQAHLALRVHPGVHGGRQEPRAQGCQQRVHAPQAGAEARVQVQQARRGPGGLELDHVQRELVGPVDVAVEVVRGARPGRGREQLVADRAHVQAAPIDDHVLQLDAPRLEQAQPPRVAHRTPPWPRRRR
jgi:hypothetical protein